MDLPRLARHRRASPRCHSRGTRTSFLLARMTNEKDGTRRLPMRRGCAASALSSNSDGTASSNSPAFYLTLSPSPAWPTLTVPHQDNPQRSSKHISPLWMQRNGVLYCGVWRLNGTRSGDQLSTGLRTTHWTQKSAITKDYSSRLGQKNPWVRFSMSQEMFSQRVV